MAVCVTIKPAIGICVQRLPSSSQCCLPPAQARHAACALRQDLRLCASTCSGRPVLRPVLLSPAMRSSALGSPVIVHQAPSTVYACATRSSFGRRRQFSSSRPLLRPSSPRAYRPPKSCGASALDLHHLRLKSNRPTSRGAHKTQSRRANAGTRCPAGSGPAAPCSWQAKSGLGRSMLASFRQRLWCLILP